MRAHAHVLMTGVVVGLLCGSSCDTGESTALSSGALAVRARVVQPVSKAQQSAATTWDTLVIRVVTTGGDTILNSIPVGPYDAVVSDTLSAVPAENGLRVDAITVGRDGDTVHQSGVQTVDLAPGETRQVSLWLNPVCGSVYIELVDVPTSVAMVEACFAFAGGSICGQQARATRVFLALDYVPDGASGDLTIVGTDAVGDTLYRAVLALTFYSDRLATLTASFTESPGGLSLSADIVEPAVTVVAGSMGATQVAASETGPLIITEIMYAANNAEYVELHNPTASAVLYDSLVLERDGVRRYLLNVAVPAGGFFVVARNDSPWADTALSLLDLSSTTGNWLAVRSTSLTVMDWVAFPGGSNEVGWPNPGSTASVVLDSLTTDPQYNNYGMHWLAAQSAISGGALN